MNSIFVDTSFVIALINESDQYHKHASRLADQFEGYPLVTTDAVLLEIGNALTKSFKKEAIAIIEYFRESCEMSTIHLNPILFQRGFSLYKSYQDKSWSIVDCISFVVMRDMEIIDALTFDRHFEQAGFHVLQ